MRYRGKLQAAILDWAGTTVDFGCQAPVAVLREIFAARDVPLAPEEARQSMGLLKKDQIRAICGLPSVAARWADRNGCPPAERDVEELFAAFVPRQLACLADHSGLLPGVAGTVQRLQRRGLKIGTTTGYTRPMLDLLLDSAVRQGYRPDCALCPDDVAAGRPFPWMCYEILVRLKVFPLEACVKIGDTASDVQEGLNAGMWTIAVAVTGNEVGLTEAEWLALPLPDRELRAAAARKRLSEAGAHYVIDALPDCEPVLEQIEARLAAGERP